VVHYNGGAITGPAGVAKALTAKPMEPFAPRSTHTGTTFDLVLEYSGSAAEGPALSHIVFQAPDYSIVTAPLTAAIIWTSDAMPNVAAYSHLFNSVSQADYEASPVADAPAPAAFVRFAYGAPAAVGAVKGARGGRFVHIKFTESGGTDENIDFGPLFLLSAPADAAPVKDCYDLTDADFAACVGASLMRAPVNRFALNPLSVDAEDTLLDIPFLCLVATEPVAAPVSDEVKAAVAAVAAVTDAYHAHAAAAAAEAAAAASGAAAAAAAAPRVSRKVNFLTLDPTTDAAVAERMLQFVGQDVSALSALVAAHRNAARPTVALAAAANVHTHPSSAFYTLPGMTDAELTQDDEEAGEDPDVADHCTPLVTAAAKPAAAAAAAAAPASVPEPSAGTLSLEGGSKWLLLAVDTRGAAVKHVFNSGRNTAAAITAALATKNIAPLSAAVPAGVPAAAVALAGEMAVFAQAFGLACSERNKVHGDNDAEDAAEAAAAEAEAQAAATAQAAAEEDEDEDVDAADAAAAGASAADDDDDESAAPRGEPVAEVDEQLMELLEARFNSAPRLAGDVHPRFPGLTVASRDTFVELAIDCDVPALVLFADVSSERATFAAALLCIFADIVHKHGLKVRPVLVDMLTNDIPAQFYSDDVYEKMKLYVKKAPKPAKLQSTKASLSGLGRAKAKRAKAKLNLKELMAAKPICVNAGGLEVFCHDLTYDKIDDEENEDADEAAAAAAMGEDEDDEASDELSLSDMLEFLTEHAPGAVPFKPESEQGKKLRAAVAEASATLEHLGETTRSPAAVFSALRTITKIRGVDAWLQPKEATLPHAAVKLYKDAYAAGMAAMRALVFPVGTLMAPLAAPAPAALDLSSARTLAQVATEVGRHAATVSRAFDAIQPVFEGLKTARALVRMATTMLTTHADFCLTVIAAAGKTKNSPFDKFGAAYTQALEQAGLFAVTPKLPAAVAAALKIDYTALDKLTAAVTGAGAAAVTVCFEAKALRALPESLGAAVDALRGPISEHFRAQLPVLTRGLLPRIRGAEGLSRAADGYVEWDVADKPAPAKKGKGKTAAAAPKGPAPSNVKVSNADSRLVCILFTEPCDDAMVHLPAIADMIEETLARHKPAVEGAASPVAFFTMAAEDAAETPFNDAIEVFPTFVFMRGGYEMAEYRVTSQVGPAMAKTVGMSIDAQLSSMSVEELAAALADTRV
jgi:hypothetical protein